LARVVWTLNAIARVDAIAEYIAQDSPAYAPLFVARLFDATAVLSQFERIGRVVPEFHDDALREIIFQSYRIVYELIDGDARVLTVIHGAMEELCILWFMV
jgi:plasmid stabilization system protein ParE